MPNDFQKITDCRACGETKLRPFFDLGEQPLANSLLDTPDGPEKSYPLSLSWCENCGLSQLDHTVDPKVLFSHYVWVTGTSRTAKEFAETFAEELIKRTPNSKEGYVLEVASNDGTFLAPFMKIGYRVLGVDPAGNVVEMARSAGVPTECAFWGSEYAEELVKKQGKAKMIFARNVLAHVADTRDFVRGLAIAVDNKGVVAVEPHYAKEILEGLQYDSIYHEHLCYFTLKPLEQLLNDAGLFVFDVERSPISGGAVIAYASKEKRDPSPALALWREAEAKGRTNEFETWKDFASRAYKHREKFLSLLDEAGKKGDVVGWGASARSSTMLNFCKIGPDRISTIVDMNPLKQGKFTAGTHIQILAPEEVLEKNPKTVCILGWNFTEEIMDILKKKYNFKGEYLIPLPIEPKIYPPNFSG